jgi:chemotaxis protein CheD
MTTPVSHRLTVMQGEMQVSDDPHVVLTTVLGSCIAACLYDPDIKIGGLNHFLLAEPGHADTDPRSQQRYGVYAMEVLINAMLTRGAARTRLRARIYGGASLHRGFRDIGATNAAFARDFLRDERIMLVGEDIGGTDARRVEFRPTLGLARCRTAPPLARVERRQAPPPPAPCGDVELF